MTKLDVSGCAKLDTLWCYSNQLTELDLSNCPSLYELSCQYNHIKELKTAGNGALAEFYCYENELQGKAMDDLIASLPTQEYAFICVLNGDDIENEHNVCTKEQVAAVNAKGWTAYQWINSAWAVYEGSEPMGIENLSPSLSEGEGAVYNLAGQRIGGMAKGLNIVDGRKVMVK